MKLYTKTGDRGQTTLADGSVLSKADQRIAVLGALDEVTAALGLLAATVAASKNPRRAAKQGSKQLAQTVNRQSVTDQIAATQSWLLTLGAYFANPNQNPPTPALPKEADIARYETWIDSLQAATPPLRQFILPGGSVASAHAHMARAVVRRAERAIVVLHSGGSAVAPSALMFINRLSDWLFALARGLNFAEGGRETIWLPPVSPKVPARPPDRRST